jgi:Fur family transcriptional regulator, peroxide stress response regulator
LISTRDVFTRHKLRCTRQRMALYDALCMCKSHPTAEELYQLAAPDLGGMSRATVYNTLETLVNAGLARKMPTATGCNRYDADTTEHLHVRMRDSGSIADVPHDLGMRLTRSLPQALLDEIERRMNIRIDGVNIQFTATTARPERTISNGA